MAARNAAAPLTPVNLRVRPQDDLDGGRGRLVLTWNTAKGVGVPAVIGDDGSVTTAAVAPQPAVAYVLHYSKTGPGDPEGYDWKLLGTVSPPDAAAQGAATQTFTDGRTTAFSQHNG